MKILCGLALTIPAISSAQMTGAERAAQQDAQRQLPAVCSPYTVQAPCAPCGNDSNSLMCKTTTATCVNGVAVTVTSADYNTAACSVSMPDTSVANCLQQPESCNGAATRSGACPAGKYWVNPPNQASPFYSSLIAVCVPSCSVGTVLSYTTSPPSCIGIVCPGNTVVAGNSCVCPVGLPIRIGNMCSAPPPPTPDCNIAPVSGVPVSCAAAGFSGYIGTAYQTDFTGHSGGGLCNTAPTGSYNQGSCAPPALPPCDAGVANGNPVTCDVAGYVGYTGTAYQTIFTTYSGGGSCTQTQAGPYAVGSCVPPMPPTCSGSPPAATVVTCSDQSSGLWTGTPYSSTPYVCSGTSWTPGGTAIINNCACANGNPAGIANCFACPPGTLGSFPSCACANGATDPLGSCQTCPTGSVMVNGMCKVPVAPPPVGTPCDPNNFPEFGSAFDRKAVVIPLQSTVGSRLSGDEKYYITKNFPDYRYVNPYSQSAIFPGSIDVWYLCLNNVKRKIIIPWSPVLYQGDIFNPVVTEHDWGTVQGGYDNLWKILDKFEATNPDAEKPDRYCMQNKLTNPYACTPIQ